MVILFDARHVGHALYNARRQNGLGKNDVSAMLGITPGELQKYEHGRMVIPVELLERLFRNGILMMQRK